MRLARGMLLGFSAIVMFQAAPASARPQSRPAAAAASEVHASHAHYEVFLTPPIQGGGVGYCLSYGSGTGGGGFSCPLRLAPGEPILDESWSGWGPPAVVQGIVLTSGGVAAVAVDGGSPISTRAEPGLPYGLRAVLLEATGPNAKALGDFLGGVVPLNAAGQTIPHSRTRPTLIETLRARQWFRPTHPPRGACQIASSHLRGLSAQWGRVVKRIHSVGGMIGRPYISCADTEYYLHNWPLDTAVVLDASHPGAAPAPLPAMRPVRGHAGYFWAHGNQTALVGRRIRGAWLVVEGGSGPQQRLTVLEHLRASIHL